MRKNKFVFIYLFMDAGVGNKKNIDLIFFVATNFYQRQSWNYSSSNIHWRQSHEYLNKSSQNKLINIKQFKTKPTMQSALGRTFKG